MPVALVTGGAGFIGSHLCDRLLADGWRVACLDNFITGTKDNLVHLADNDDFELIEHDICNPIDVDVEPSVVWHLASLASPEAYFSKPIETLEVGSVGTRNALDLAQASGARFVFTSTSE
ncbi:MAG: NAD-dependent epimerase/dehydratase family protein, partial [Actinomycetota bacterium]